MNIIIIGNGKVGRALTEKLSYQGHNIVVIDKDYTKTYKIVNNYDVRAICGNGAVYDTQMKADVDKSDLVISVTSSDETNLISSITAKSLSAKNTIARISDLEYIYQDKFIKENFKLNMVINQEKLVSEEILRTLNIPSWIKIKHLVNESVKFVEITLNKDNRMINSKVSEINKKFKSNLLVYAIKRNENTYIANDDFILQENDVVYSFIDEVYLNSFFKSIGVVDKKIESAMIVGGGKTSIYLANELVSMGVKVKIIEKDAEICRSLTQLTPKSKIINEDGTVQDILLEEGITNTDVFISMTGVDETNIIMSMYAHHCNVPKVITKTNNTDIIRLLEFSGLNTFISPMEIVSNEVIQFVQEKESVIIDEYISDRTNNKIKVSKFKVNSNDKVVGYGLRNLNKKNDIKIAMIIRNEEMIIPTDVEFIKEDDEILVVSTKNKHFIKLENLIN